MAKRQFTYTEIKLNQLRHSDLRAEAGRWSEDTASAYSIGIFKKNGIDTEAEGAEALYVDGRMGIAWGADATWADVKDVESGIEMWLNDGEAWTAAN